MKIDILFGLAEGHGGLETALTLVTRELKRQGHEPRLFQVQESPHPQWERELPMYHYDPTAFGYPPRYVGEPDQLRWMLGYRMLLETAGRPDVILATHTPIFSLIARTAVGIGPDAPPVISWLHGPAEVYGDPSPLTFADAHLAISKGVGDSLRQAIGQCPVHFVGNPIDMDVPEIPRPKDGTEFLFLGRLEAQKRPDRLLRALAKVQGQWHLSIYGDGTLGDRMQELGSSLGIGRRITWHGWRPEPWQEIAEASALVLSSDYEGFGLVLAEALARGVPVVSTDIVGPADFVRSGENGWLIRKDEGALAGILGRIVSGATPLPPPDVCRASMREFAPDVVCQRILQAITYVKAYSERL